VVRSTAEWFSTWLDETLRRYRGEPAEGATPRYSVVVGRTTGDPRSGPRGLHILYAGTAAVVRTRDLRTLARSLLAELGTTALAHRDDAIYLSAGTITAGGAAAILPSFFLSRLARLRRRAEMAGVLLPGTMMVALDLSGNRLLPVSSLDMDPDALDRLASLGGDDTRDERAFIDEPVPVAAVLSLGPSEIRGLSPMSRSRALYRWGSRVVNLRVLGGPALESVGRLMDEVPCLQVGWEDPVDWFAPLADLLRDASDVHRREVDGARGAYALRGTGNTRRGR
jgi:hypothetical protein